MNTPESHRKIDRRQALSGGLAACAGMALFGPRAGAGVRMSAAPLAPTANSLLLVQLTGGNDGLSMVVPHAEDAYYRARPALAVPRGDVLPIDDYRGLHPQLQGLRELYDRGELAIVEGVGYPDPVRSHFKSFEIWHTADARGRAAGDGWVGRLCASAWPEDANPNLMVHVGARAPYSLQSSTHPAVAFSSPATYRWAGDERERAAFGQLGSAAGADAAGGAAASSDLDFLRRTLVDGRASSDVIRATTLGYETGVGYPNNAFSLALRDVAALAKSGIGSRVYSVELGGFDTHVDQPTRYGPLMAALDGGLSAFAADLRSSAAAEELLVVVFSEFGRRVHENGSGGTDHGVAGPLLVWGAPVKGGLYGAHPSLAELDDGDLAHTTDFRSVYGTLIERWFDVPQEPVLGAEYPLLDLV